MNRNKEPGEPILALAFLLTLPWLALIGFLFAQYELSDPQGAGTGAAIMLIFIFILNLKPAYKISDWRYDRWQRKQETQVKDENWKRSHTMGFDHPTVRY